MNTKNNIGFVSLFVTLLVGFSLGILYVKSNIPAKDSISQNTFTYIAPFEPAESAFDNFVMKYPSSMKLTVNNVQIEEPSYTDNSESLFLNLEIGNSEMNLVSAAMGGGGCLYPTDPDLEGPYSKYGSYLTLRTDKGFWRRSLSLGTSFTDDTRTLYVVCSNVDEEGIFSSTTLVGAISYKIEPGEEKYIAEFDEIVRNIEILEN